MRVHLDLLGRSGKHDLQAIGFEALEQLAHVRERTRLRQVVAEEDLGAKPIELSAELVHVLLRQE